MKKLPDPQLGIINSTEPCPEKLTVVQLARNLPVILEVLKAVTTEDHTSEM
jgi:hypothetical protein